MSLGRKSNLDLIFRMIDPLKIGVCSLKLVKMTTQHKKWRLGDEYTREAPLPGVEYIEQSWLPGS
jgi:hypothetical protein